MGVALGVSVVGRGGGSVGMGEGPSVGFGVWVGARVRILSSVMPVILSSYGLTKLKSSITGIF